jgi:uncharacterized membrane protein
MLQAPNIAAAAGAELDEVIHAEPLGEASNGNEQQSIHSSQDTFLETEGVPVQVQHTGYIRYIDLEYLLEIAREKNLVIRLLYRPGQYIWNGKTVARVWQAVQTDERLDRQVRRAFLIGNQRTPAQDIEYGVDQLVEIAVRAQSSGIRDPFTAMTCLDHIGHSLAQFIRQGEITPNICDPEGRLRLIIQPVTFAELLNSAFEMLRHNSRDNARILLHMLEIIDAISQEAKSPAARQELLRHVVLIQAESHKGALIEADIQLIQQRCEELQAKWIEIRFSEPQNPFGTNELSYAE